MANKVSMKLNLKPDSVIETNVGIQDGGPVHKLLTNTCYKHMDKYTPYQEGYLAYDNVVVGVDEIVYNSPYAHYMYEGILYVDSVTGSSWARKGTAKVPTNKRLNYHKSSGHEYAGPYWDKRMWSAEGTQIIKEIQDKIDGAVKMATYDLKVSDTNGNK